ncbi:hypothetical protein CLOSTASPAR_03284 [[Clostridium] asparagiforme DSM 15981]|uniref:Uncharacterized protein n=1 Tax=[Clostridium] asparagiforme DSM 15981 TaxID=518636 RepID=C0D1Z5_9FIRM|nr:hypothetical protein CLOSTASPAR_03284 [[Clostridium] asparagiforme DSM 15981]
MIRRRNSCGVSENKRKGWYFAYIMVGRDARRTASMRTDKRR